MAETREIRSDYLLKTVVISRAFDAPRRLVFEAWSTADHLKRWFSPEHYTVSAAEVDFRPGGVFSVCMRSPTGQEHWSRGAFVDLSPPDRLSFVSRVSEGDLSLFTAYTTVNFEETAEGTLMTVQQAYEIHDEHAQFAIDGAPEGWRTTLDKLGVEVARLAAASAAPPRR